LYLNTISAVASLGSKTMSTLYLSLVDGIQNNIFQLC